MKKNVELEVGNRRPIWRKILAYWYGRMQDAVGCGRVLAVRQQLDIELYVFCLGIGILSKELTKCVLWDGVG